MRIQSGIDPGSMPGYGQTDAEGDSHDQTYPAMHQLRICANRVLKRFHEALAQHEPLYYLVSNTGAVYSVESQLHTKPPTVCLQVPSLNWGLADLPVPLPQYCGPCSSAIACCSKRRALEVRAVIDDLICCIRS